MIHFTIFITATILLLALAGIISWDLAPLVLPPRDPERGSIAARARAHLASVRADLAGLNAVTVRALRARDPQILRDYRDSQAVPRRPAQTRLLAEMEPEAGSVPPHPAGPAGTVPADGPPVHAGAVPLTPRGRHHAGQPRQPWDTAELPAVPACETEPVPEPELYTCEPHQAVPGFYRRFEQQQHRRLS